MTGMTSETLEAGALLDAMHAHAEERYAGWLHDMEFTLWSAVVRDGKHETDIGTAQARRLRDLASEAGGWWVHCSTVGADWQASGGRVFLPTEKWCALYAGGPKETT